MPEQSVLRKSYPRVDAADKVTGRSQYAGDVYLPGMLYCKVLKSPRSHARIVSVDTSRAEQLPGVRSVITARDFPDVRFGSGALKDRRVLALEKVHYIGEPIAAVAAVDEMTAQEALELIEVQYEDLPRVVSSLDAVKPDAPVVHQDLPDFVGYTFAMGGNVCTLLDSDRGDVDRAFQESDYLFEDTFRSQGINQGFLEPMACVASVDPSGRINVWVSSQGPYQIRAQLADVLGVPVSRVRVIPMELGGGFGAKLRLCIEAYPVMLALKTSKPVKLNATREEVFTLCGPRLPTNIYLKTGVMRDGTIVAREAVSVFDMGAYLGAGPASGINHALGAYRIPNFRLRSYAVYTNKIWTGSYRASGVADMTFAVESHMDIIARKMGMVPLEFRLKNALEEGDTTVSGARLPKNGLKETLRAVGERLSKKALTPAFGHPSPTGGRGEGSEGFDSGNVATGVGIALCEWRSGSGPSTASVSLNEDGTISVLTGSVDISGTDTVLAQIAAETLGIGMEQVVIARRDTDLAPYTQPSGGSRIIYSQGKAVQMAAEDTRRKLLALAAERLQVKPDALGCAGGRVYVQDNPPQGYTLAQLARMSLTSRGGPIIGTGSLSSMPYAPVFNTQGVEVKVDRETGQIRVTRLVQAQDVGTPINPMALEGQMEGGAIQGIGRALTENVLVSGADGRLLNPSFTTYLMPLAADMPAVENILVEVPSEEGPFGARAVAEPPGFGPPAAIANAVYDAVGVRIKELPITPEKVLAALRGEAPEEPKLDVQSLIEQKGGGGGQGPGFG